MDQEYVIGLDIGTTNVKGILFSTTGKVIFEQEKNIHTEFTENDRAEQNPLEIEKTLIQVLKTIVQFSQKLNGKIIAIGLSTAMHSLIMVDEKFRPISNVIIWSDGRSNDLTNLLMSEEGKDIYERTGTPIHPMNPFVKLLWMNEVDYEPYEKATYIMTVKDYLVARWFGVRLIDYSMASSTGLFNIHTYDWDDTVLKRAGIQRSQLSTPVPPDYKLPDIMPEIAREVGIDNQTPFIIGAADGQLANLGSGAIDKGEISITVGTSGAVRMFIPGISIDNAQTTFCYAFTRDTSVIGGPTNNGGIVLQWLKNIFKFSGEFPEFIQLAEQVPIGSNGIIFIPFINGERAPLWRKDAKGTFFGLHVSHDRAHFIRAALEGISFNLYQIAGNLSKQNLQQDKIYVSGGLARSSTWVQMLADIFGKPIYQTTNPHSSAWGAAWIALYAVGKVSALHEIKKYIEIHQIFEPDQNRHEQYIVHYNSYEKLGKMLAQFY